MSASWAPPWQQGAAALLYPRPVPAWQGSCRRSKRAGPAGGGVRTPGCQAAGLGEVCFVLKLWTPRPSRQHCRPTPPPRRGEPALCPEFRVPSHPCRQGRAGQVQGTSSCGRGQGSSSGVGWGGDPSRLSRPLDRPAPRIPESALWPPSPPPHWGLRGGAEELGYQIICSALGVICFNFFGTTTIKSKKKSSKTYKKAFRDANTS